MSRTLEVKFQKPSAMPVDLTSFKTAENKQPDGRCFEKLDCIPVDNLLYARENVNNQSSEQ